MKSNRLLRIVIILLMSANLFLIFRLFNEPHHPPRLSRIVNAEGKQALQLDNEMHKHRRTILTWEKKLFRLRQKLVRTNASESQLRGQLLNQIALCQRAMDSVTLVHFDRVAASCTPAQEHKFKRFRTQILAPHPIH